MTTFIRIKKLFYPDNGFYPDRNTTVHDVVDVRTFDFSRDSFVKSFTNHQYNN